MYHLHENFIKFVQEDLRMFLFLIILFKVVNFLRESELLSSHEVFFYFHFLKKCQIFFKNYLLIHVQLTIKRFVVMMYLPTVNSSCLYNLTSFYFQLLKVFYFYLKCDQLISKYHLLAFFSKIQFKFIFHYSHFDFMDL